MTLRGRLVSLLPAAFLCAGTATTIGFARSPSVASLLAALFAWYLLPPLCFRVHDWLCPLREGKEDLSDGARYSAWWGSQQFQIVYAVVPQLERALRLVPGAYSAWLRLWGSRIGRRVVWTPVVEIIDRSLLDIGDGAFFGHQVALASHTVTPRTGRQILRVARIRVGAGAFFSGRCGLGPGARVDAGEFLPFGTRVYFNRRLK